MPATRPDLAAQLLDQLDQHWTNLVRPKLTGLTDAEYLWEPAPGCWNVRPRDPAARAPQPGSGPWTVDFAFPEPDPSPLTTIAWRLAHVVVGVFGMRVASHFDGPPVGYDDFPYAGTADVALEQLDDVYAGWVAGVRRLDADAMARPVGPAEGAFAEHTMSELVLHINREAIHHGAEILLLRDLYRSRRAGSRPTAR